MGRERGFSSSVSFSFSPCPVRSHSHPQTIAAATHRRRCSPRGGAEPEELDLRRRIPGSMATGSGDARLQELRSTPPSSPSSSRAARREDCGLLSRLRPSRRAVGCAAGRRLSHFPCAASVLGRPSKTAAPDQYTLRLHKALMFNAQRCHPYQK